MGWSTLSSYTSEVQRNSSNWIHMIGKYLQVYRSINGLISLCGGIPRKKNLWFLSGKTATSLPRPHVFSKMVQIRESFSWKKSWSIFGLVKSFVSMIFWGGSKILSVDTDELGFDFSNVTRSLLFFLIVTQASATKGRVGSSVDEKSLSTFSISNFQI